MIKNVFQNAVENPVTVLFIYFCMFEESFSCFSNYLVCTIHYYTLLFVEIVGRTSYDRIQSTGDGYEFKPKKCL